MQKHDDTWKEEPGKEIKRVFRTQKVPFEQDKRILVTVNRPEGLDQGSSVRALVIKKTFNHAGQYVLQDNEQEYAKQLATLRRAQGNRKILEVDPSWEGKPFVPPPPPDAKDDKIKALEEENARLVAMTSKKGAKVSGGDETSQA